MNLSCKDCKSNIDGRCSQRGLLHVDPDSEICSRFYNRKTRKRTIFNLASISPYEMAKRMVFQVREADGSIAYTFPFSTKVSNYPSRAEAIMACRDFLLTEVEE